MCTWWYFIHNVGSTLPPLLLTPLCLFSINLSLLVLSQPPGSTLILRQYPNPPRHLPPLLMIVLSLFSLSYQNFMKDTYMYIIFLTLSKHTLIADNQFGFLPSRSVSLALLSSTPESYLYWIHTHLFVVHFLIFRKHLTLFLILP